MAIQKLNQTTPQTNTSRAQTAQQQGKLQGRSVKPAPQQAASGLAQSTLQSSTESRAPLRIRELNITPIALYENSGTYGATEAKVNGLGMKIIDLVQAG